MIFAILVSLYIFIATPIIVIRIAKHGKSFLKPNFQKALEKINEDNPIGSILVQHKCFIVLNAIAYYLLLLGWLVAVGAIIYWLVT
jgi:hypothetical protein